ncbi:MAG TPA: phenylalanine--tRNA ligase subunit beta, partial [Polyangiaceae bacterium LLY-WYZ-15_(1-7)]|nr:phenylalanine--tRNA ligase subunit beta [Polyangiaceae bacterium LLY-WYZ-15_(1-7)]
MKASYQWLKELTGIDATPEELAEKMTDLGLEVEGLERFEAAPLVVVAEVRAKEKHPKRDKLTVVQVDDGSGEDVTVVCGAPNVPEVGGKVLFAQVGAKLPTEDGGVFEIGERKLGGVLSRGMICSERELNLGAGHEGIFVFGPDAPANGTPLAEALPVGDVVFEIGLTPNRPDCLGHLGLARDLCAAWGKPFTPPPVPTPRHAEGVVAVVPKGETTFRLPWSGDGPEVAWDGPSDALGPFAVDIEDAEGCPRYGAAFVLAVKVGPSPFWLRYRLHCLGHRSISNLVDATNLVMLETGHPIHGFDLETLRGRRIVVRGAEAGETMTTLDDEERELAPGDLLICDGEGPVALAGVMGGANSEIGDGTQHVAIECAYFDPRAVRRTSRRLGMHTDASHRFERGVDPNDVPRVLARAAALMAELGGGVALAEGLDAYPAPVQAKEVTLRRHVLDGLLGLEVPKEVPAKVLGDLGFEVLEDGEDAVKVAVPTWRPDVAREADLVEEVGRVYGYERVPTVVPPVQPSRSGTSARIQL